MRRSGNAIVIVGLLLTLTPAYAGLPEEVCCACLVDPEAMQGAASFCALVPFSPPEHVQNFENRCENTGGGTLCVRTHDLECTARFAEIDIACNATAPAPLLGAGALTGLALGLAGLGTWAIRRRFQG